MDSVEAIDGPLPLTDDGEAIEQMRSFNLLGIVFKRTRFTDHRVAAYWQMHALRDSVAAAPCAGL